VRKGHVQTDKHWSKNAIEVQRINRSLNGEKN
jgi:hypothetical protein